MQSEDIVKRYEHDPVKHCARPTAYKQKTCLDCGCKFECPGNWRRTQRCPDCDASYEQHARQVRIQTKKLLKASGLPRICAGCGRIDSIDAHHIRPIVKGGNGELENVQLLCTQCHGKQHAGLLKR